MILRLITSIVARFRKPMKLGSARANQLVLAEIAEQGDDGSEERHVRHFAYPQRGGFAKGIDLAMELFAEAGLDVSETQFRGGVLGEHYAAVAEDEFNTLTENLSEELTRLGWEYDGWECAVLKG